MKNLADRERPHERSSFNHPMAIVKGASHIVKLGVIAVTHIPSPSCLFSFYTIPVSLNFNLKNSSLLPFFTACMHACTVTRCTIDDGLAPKILLILGHKLCMKFQIHTHYIVLFRILRKTHSLISCRCLLLLFTKMQSKC